MTVGWQRLSDGASAPFALQPKTSPQRAGFYFQAARTALSITLIGYRNGNNPACALDRCKPSRTPPTGDGGTALPVWLCHPALQL